MGTQVCCLVCQKLWLLLSFSTFAMHLQCTKGSNAVRLPISSVA